MSPGGTLDVLLFCIFQNLFYVKYAAKDVWMRPDGHECAEMTNKTLEVIDHHGNKACLLNFLFLRTFGGITV